MVFRHWPPVVFVSNGEIYVSVILFYTSVNVGSLNYTQSGLDLTDYGKCSSDGWDFSSSY